MTSPPDQEVYDLLNATYSMNSYLRSLQTSLPKIIQISNLTNCFSQIGLLAYRDCSDKLSDSAKVDLLAKAKSLYSMGGGDGPKATKTGLAKASNESMTDKSSNLGAEQRALKSKLSYGGFGPNFRDWVSATNWLSKRAGDKKAVVFSILECFQKFEIGGYYNYLSARTAYEAMRTSGIN
ncbi:hypothetical protein DL98DRAFT_552120 [Cadophora sp. DSE1049]|nr:hypothetical protein DL98DRAFT_552120 [Cadophora sp. DSE1049]